MAGVSHERCQEPLGVASQCEREHLRAARRVLGAWDLEVADVRRISISENIVFRVEDAAGKRYVLRLYRPGYRTLQELVSEQLWTQALIADGIDAQKPVPARSGRGHVAVDLAGERRYAGLVAWVAGETLDDVIEATRDAANGRATTSLRFLALGAVIAAIHNHAATWRLPGNFARHALDADGLVGERPFWGRFWESAHLDPPQRRRLDALRHPIHDILSRYGKDAATYSLIHGDMHPGNVVVSGGRLHVIDFDDAGFGWHAYDCAVALYGYRDVPQFEALRAALIAGYRAVRPISDAALDLVPLFLLVRSLIGIGWVTARPELDSTFIPSLVQEVEAQANAVLSAW